MPAKKRNGNGNSSGIGSMSAKQLKRKKPINTDKMVDIQPLTKNQEKFFDAYKDCLLYTSPSPRDSFRSRMPSSA